MACSHLHLRRLACDLLRGFLWRKLDNARLEALGLEEVTITDGAHRFADNLPQIGVVKN